MWILLVISLLVFGISGILYYKVINEHNTIQKINEDIIQQNNTIEEKNKELRKISESLKIEKTMVSNQLNDLQNEHKREKERLRDLQDTINTTIDNQNQLAQTAYENYCENLENKKRIKEQEILESEEWLNKALEKHQEEVLNNMEILDSKYKKEKDKIEEDLEQLKATRAAIIQANIKEKEIEENSTFYCLTISEIDKADIKMLENIKPQLNKPRVLSMLIWSTFFQKPMTTLCNNIIGTSTVTGIYKITNQVTKECYIGQSVDISKRWKDHAKCGLGIDTPAGNKLYKAMQTYGIWNFSWEVLEQCSKDLLDEKEKYYIDLYDSYNLGYNSNTGIGRK